MSHIGHTGFTSTGVENPYTRAFWRELGSKKNINTRSDRLLNKVRGLPVTHTSTLSNRQHRKLNQARRYASAVGDTQRPSCGRPCVLCLGQYSNNWQPHRPFPTSSDSCLQKLCECPSDYSGHSGESTSLGGRATGLCLGGESRQVWLHRARLAG
jgi:hypothetical protein